MLAHLIWWRRHDFCIKQMTFIYDLCKLINKIIYMNTHRQTRDIGDKIEFAHLYMLEHMLFYVQPRLVVSEPVVLSPTSVGPQNPTCYMRQVGDSKNMGSPQATWKTWMSHLDFADCFSGLFFFGCKNSWYWLQLLHHMISEEFERYWITGP